jgi:hypothetical protein
VNYKSSNKKIKNIKTKKIKENSLEIIQGSSPFDFLFRKN